MNKNRKHVNENKLQEAIDSLLQMKPFTLLDLIDGIDAKDGHTYGWYVRHAGNVNVLKLFISDCINYIDFLFSQEIFCDGFVDVCMRDGSFLRILFRIRDLMM